MVQIITGDALDQLRGLPDASVHCCVTSPPYYGLRDYGVDGQVGKEARSDLPSPYHAHVIQPAVKHAEDGHRFADFVNQDIAA